MSARPAGTRFLTGQAPSPALDSLPAEAAADATPVLFELAVPAGSSRALLRHGAIAAARSGRMRTTNETILYHDTADGALAAAGLTLAVVTSGRTHWQRLTRLWPDDAERFDPGLAPAVLAEQRIDTATPDTRLLADWLADDADQPLQAAPPTAFAAVRGRRSVLALAGAAPMTLELFSGSVRTVAAERPVERLQLRVPPCAVDAALALLRTLAEELPLTVPWVSIAEEARALASGTPPRPLRRGAPDLSGAQSVEDGALRAIGHLTLALAGCAPIAIEGTNPEGVHQARVAVRRLRSVLALFKPAIGCARVADLRDRLGGLARTLGPARDWDVFIGGTLADLRAAFGEDEPIVWLARAAEAARAQAYASVREMLEGPAFRLLTLDLAALVASPPWRTDESLGGAELRESGLRAFAVSALERRWRKVKRLGRDFETLDTERLHRVRIEAKKLRYAGELFGPVFPGKRHRRFQKALAQLQDCLGHLNDVATADTLMQGLPSRGAGRTLAIGIVRGWTAAKAEAARAGAGEAWAEFLDRDPFWRD